MIKKINDNAYFVVDIYAFCSSVNGYDNVLANQTIMSQESDPDLMLSRENIDECHDQNEQRASLFPILD
jgi:hypothetical protein